MAWFLIQHMIINTNVVFRRKVGIQPVRQSLDQVQLGWIEIQTEYDNAISNQNFVLEIISIISVGELLVQLGTVRKLRLYT